MISQDFYPSGINLIFLLPTIIGFLVRIGVAFFIARDAVKRGLEPTIYVLVTCCCGCCIGGIVYLITASNHPNQRDDFEQPTFSSHQRQEYGQPQQPIYGQPQTQQPRQPPQPRPGYSDASTTMPNLNLAICPLCGSENKKNAKFCHMCGATLK